MLSRIAVVVTGLALITSSLGCCCLGGGYRSPCSPCASPCSTGACGPGAYYPPAGGPGYYNGASLNNSAALPVGTVASLPTFPTTALAPTQLVPTY